MNEALGPVGSRDWELPCVCGHLKDKHNFEPYEVLGYKYSGMAYCESCYRKPNNAHIHFFKLDNLALVEQVARAKGLL